MKKDKDLLKLILKVEKDVLKIQKHVLQIKNDNPNINNILDAYNNLESTLIKNNKAIKSKFPDYFLNKNADDIIKNTEKIISNQKKIINQKNDCKPIKNPNKNNYNSNPEKKFTDKNFIKRNITFGNQNHNNHKIKKDQEEERKRKEKMNYITIPIKNEYNNNFNNNINKNFNNNQMRNTTHQNEPKTIYRNTFDPVKKHSHHPLDKVLKKIDQKKIPTKFKLENYTMNNSISENNLKVHRYTLFNQNRIFEQPESRQNHYQSHYYGKI